MGGAVGPFEGAPFTTISAEFGKTLGQGDGFGNETPWAEFNIYCDPEAAQAVFSNPTVAAKTTLISLDLTHQCLATQKVRKQMLGEGQEPSLLRRLLDEILGFFAQSYEEWFNVTAGPPLHDPLAVAVLFGYNDGEGGSIFVDDGVRYQVEVVTDGKHSPLDRVRGQVGRTVVERVEDVGALGVGGVRIPRRLDVDRFWAMLEGCAARADRYMEGRV